MLVFLLDGCGFQPFSENDLNWAIKQLIPPKSKIISLSSKGSGFDPNEYITSQINIPDDMTKSYYQEWVQKKLEKKGWKIEGIVNSYSIKFINSGGMVTFRFDNNNYVIIQITFSTKETTYDNIRDYF